jgi:hypothetical protein
MIGLLLLAVAFAGHEVNNGGHAVVCGKQAPRLLDYVEYKVEAKGVGDHRPVVERLLAKLESVDAKTGAQYRRRWGKWDAESELLEGVELRQVRDSLHTAVPKGCRLRQLAVRHQQPIGGQKRFAIDKSLWDQLTAVDRAGLVMHELIYEHFVFLGEKDSRKARAFNAYVARASEPMDRTAYVKFVRELKVPLYP